MLIGLLHVNLHKGARQLLLLPWRRRFTGAQPNDHVLPSRRLAGMQRDILNDAVALVEDAEHGHALCHWSDAALTMSSRGGLPRGGCRRIPLLGGPAACCERQDNQQRCGVALHAYSGIQGS
jgi:hypothetical protein